MYLDPGPVFTIVYCSGIDTRGLISRDVSFTTVTEHHKASCCDPQGAEEGARAPVIHPTDQTRSPVASVTVLLHQCARTWLD